ncbi:DUF1566 domain-containing protein [Gilvimarinus sp. SDUM040013]|uniref:DUF1566 domain-containing protein n=1 Tax=Gilvimarinus gilvus TaxID=3058038 RepID=A0ABU4S4Q2_9GAMM|nr:DUF1566 domain-containing protein [Gilvimarinus sp. SDUM040013]MDX6851396.1 DUF1566 domain-containing protein [Gilvimarinus sp. SDUM040013]
MQTGLEWKRCAEPAEWDGTQCVMAEATSQLYVKYQQRMLEGLVLEDGWRIPSLEELESIVYCSDGVLEGNDGEFYKCDFGSYSPTLNRAVFSDDQPEHNYWSKTPTTRLDDAYYGVRFESGLVWEIPLAEYNSLGEREFYTSAYLRLVRGIMPAEYKLSVASQGEGTGTVTISQEGTDCSTGCVLERSSGTEVQIVAEPDPGMIFARWSGACRNTTNECVVNLDSDLEVHAHFLVDPYEFPSDGVVFDTDTGLEWQRCAYGQKWTGETCEGSSQKFTLEKLESQVFPGGWRLPTRNELVSIVYCDSGHPSFEGDYVLPCLNEYSTPTISAWAFPNPLEEIYWSSSFYAQRPVVVNFATGRAGYINSFSNLPLRLVRDTVPPESIQLEMSVIGSGAITVGDMICDDVCTNNYSNVTSIVLEAAPVSGSRFYRWKGLCSGFEPTCEVTNWHEVEQVSAVFVADRYEIRGPEGSIVYDSTTDLEWQRCSRGQIWTDGACAGDAERVSRRILNASLPEDGWRLPEIEELKSLVLCDSGAPMLQDLIDQRCEGDFTSPVISQTAFPDTDTSRYWSNTHSHSDFYRTLNFDNGANGTARFDYYRNVRYVRDAEVATNDLTVTISGTGSGTVMSLPTGIECGQQCSAGFTNDDEITLTANASSDSRFVGWAGGCSGDSTQCALTMNESKAVEAIFERELQAFIHYPSQVLAVGGSMELDGSVSTSTVHEITDYQWTLFPETNVIGTDAVLPIVDLAPGQYEFVLEVENSVGQISTSSVIIDVGYPPIAVAPERVVGYPNEEILIDGSSSSVQQGELTYQWVVDGEVQTPGPKLRLNFENAGNYTATLEVASDLGLTATATVAIEVLNDLQDLVSCPVLPVTEDHNLSLEYPENDIPWVGGQADNVADIQRAFNYARSVDPSVSQYLIMPAQPEWDAMNLQQKGFFLVNAERVARGIKPYSGYDSAITSVAQNYSDYMLDNNLEISHYYQNSTAFERMMSSDYSANNADGYIGKTESLASYVNNAEGSSPEAALVKSVYNWIYHDKRWYLAFGLTSGIEWGHRDHLLQTGLQDNHGDPSTEGVGGFGVAPGLYNPSVVTPDSFGSVVTFNTLDQGPDWESSRIESVDISQAQGCISYAIGFPGQGAVLEGLESLRVEPSSLHLAVGQSKILSIIGRYTDGSEVDLSSLGNLEANETSVVEVSSGIVSALKPGPATVYAKIGGLESNRLYVTVGESVDTAVFTGTEAEVAASYIAPNATLPGGYSLTEAGSTAAEYNPKAMAIYTGLVFDRYGIPLSDVKVSLLDAQNYGSVLTDNNGRFILAGPAGEQTAVYQKPGHVVVQRTRIGASSQWAAYENITLLERDSKKTLIDLTSGVAQVHESTPIVDEYGERRTTLIFNGATSASIHSADGSIRHIDSFEVSATDFETPQSMPGDLPKDVAFTWAADLHVEGAHYTDEVHFDKNVTLILDNFIDFEVGEVLPLGNYNMRTGLWEALDNGIVVQTLDENGDGLVDGLDYTGDALADDLNGNGSTQDEAVGLENLPTGKTLWWASVSHFSTKDLNQGQAEDESPDNPEVESGEEKPDDDDCVNTGSYLKAFQQTFHEDIPIAGTNLTLHYASQRTEGYKHKIWVQVSGSEVPGTLLSMVAKLEIAGHVFEQRFSPEPNVEAEFIWDGTAVDGSQIQGLVSGKVSIGFEYQTVYTSPGNAAAEGRALDDYPRAWATVSDITTQVPGRDRYVAWQSSGITLKNSFDRQLANGWSLSNVHELDPSGKVYLGSGATTDIASPSSILKTGQTYSHYEGDDGYYQAGGNVVDYSISDENTLIDHVTGLEWQNERNPYRTVSKQDAANYCQNIAEPLNSGWRLPTPKEVGYTIDKSGGTPEQRIYSTVQARNMWHTNTLNNELREIPAVCVRGDVLDLKTVENLTRNSSKDVVVDQDNGLMWQDAPDNVDLTLTWEESIDYCEASTHAGYDNWRLPNINELLFVLSNNIFEYETTLNLPPGVGWNQDSPERNPYWSSTSNIRDESQAWVIESISFNSDRFNKVDEYHVRCIREDSSAVRSPYRFDSDGRHVATVDVNSGVVLQHIEYDESGRLKAVSDQFENTILIERNFAGVPERIVAPDGEVTWLTVDQFGDLDEVSYEDSTRYSFSYISGGLLTSKIDPRDKTFTRQYDGNGRIEKVWDPMEGFWTIFDERLEAGSSRYGYTTSENNTHQSVRTVLENGDVQTSTTTKTGANISYTRSANDLAKTTSAYGMTYQEISMLDPKTLRPIPSQEVITTPSGIVHTTDIIKTYGENGADTSSFTYTASTNDKVSTVAYDSEAGLATYTSPEGRTFSRRFDTETLLVAGIDAPGLHSVDYKYDVRGRLEESKVGARVTTYSYDDSDDRGRLSSVTTPDNKVTSYDYDSMGRVERIEYNDSHATEFHYDENGNTTKVIVPTLAEHDITYNDANLPETEGRPLSVDTVYAYNGENQLEKITLPSEGVIDFFYEAGKLDKVVRPESTTVYRYQQGDQIDEIETGTELVDYDYDGLLLTQKRYGGEINEAIDYGYNTDFLVDSLSYAGGTTELAYDNDGLLTGIHGFTLDYKPETSLPKSVSIDTWGQTILWNSYGEVSDVAYYQSGSELYSYGLIYNDAGLIEQKTEALSDGSVDTYTYVYDDRNRLDEVKKNDVVVEDYDYDANGNRTGRTSTELGVAGQIATHNPGDQLATQGNASYQYDEDGRLMKKTVVGESGSETTTYQYDSVGGLVFVTTPTSIIEYRHNALGQRVVKLINGQAVEKYLWQDLTTLLATYDGQDNLKQRFEYTIGHTPTSFTQDGDRFFIQTDHLGSPRLIVDESGGVVKILRYDSYGNVIEDSNPNFDLPFGFAGGLFDKDTGLIRFGFRDYAPEIGRWTARDPIGFSGGDTNLYGYVLGNPVGFIDSNGMHYETASSALNSRYNIARQRGRESGSAQVYFVYRHLPGILNTIKTKGDHWAGNRSGDYAVTTPTDAQPYGSYFYDPSSMDPQYVDTIKDHLVVAAIVFPDHAILSEVLRIAQQLADKLDVNVKWSIGDADHGLVKPDNCP